jgi:hypothetical protein
MTTLGIDAATKKYANATALDAVCLQFPDGVLTGGPVLATVVRLQ